MNGKRNLFTSLHRWAGRQDENFTTEALVNILDLLLEYEPQIGLSVLQKLSCGVLDLKEASSVQITTQPRTAEGVPDVEISAPDLLVYIEAKVYSDLGENQLESYRRALADSGLPRTGLVLLTHYPPTGSISQDVYAIRWHQIAEWLEVELGQSITDPICRYLTAEFLEFLRERGLSITPVRSPISEAIRNYQKRTGQIPGQERRIRNLEMLAAESGLQPLTSLLAAMGQALNVLQLSMTPSLDSGKGEGGGWIGYNINSMEYFFCIYLSNPDSIVFEAFQRIVDRDAWDGERGELFTSYGALRWRDALDLADPSIDFFTKSADQIHILEKFVRSSFDTSQTVTHPKRNAPTTTQENGGEQGKATAA